MKVLKFGGSSVGSREGILHVRDIVSRTKRPVVVVVSALGGVTDRLIALMKQAADGDEAYVSELEALEKRHRQMVNDVIAEAKRPALLERLEVLLAELRSILHGVFLIHDLTPKTSDVIVAYGERLSSLIVADLLEEARHIDSRQLIKTTRQGEKHIVIDMVRAGQVIQDQ